VKIVDAALSQGYTGFYFDDQNAIKHHAIQDGFSYIGAPLTKGLGELAMDCGNREEQWQQLKSLRALLKEKEIHVEIVADEWCNTKEDILWTNKL
jgi:methylaspartate ammonia-lyase